MTEQTENDRKWMRAAIALGARGLGMTAPNPSVGCIILDHNNRVIGRGVTGRGGRPHAEAAALQQAQDHASDRLAGATAYVTLEPCAHHGKTPPCADALAASGVKRVVSAMEDPDSRVAGRGHERLRAAGIAVETNVLRDEAGQSHIGHLRRILLGRPFLTVKLAISLDGRIATRAGESQWITSKAAREKVHLMRTQHDAVMIGIGTALADDPLLTVRLPGLVDRRPVRIVLDSNGRLSPKAKLLNNIDKLGPVWLVHGHAAPQEYLRALQDRGAVLLQVPLGADGRIDARAAMARFAKEGLTRVFCEGGGGLAATLCREGLVDRLAVVTAGKILGGDGWPAIASLDLSTLKDAPTLGLRDAWTADGEVWSLWIKK